MARRPTRAATRSQDVDESGTKSGTGETPPANTAAITQPGARATPPVDLGFLHPSSSSIRVSAYSREACRRMHSSFDLLKLHTAAHHAQNKPTRQKHVDDFAGNKNGKCRYSRLGLPHRQFYIKRSDPASTITTDNTSSIATRTTMSTSNREGIRDIIGVFVIVQQLGQHQFHQLPGGISDYSCYTRWH